MNSRSYKIIFALLIFSVLAVLMLQAFWIRNFYIQKCDEFDKSVYVALEKVNEKLEEKQNLKVIKDRMMPELKTQSKKQDLKITQTYNSSVHVSSINNNHNQSVTQVVKVEPGKESSAIIINSDSVFTTIKSPKILIAQNKIKISDTTFSINKPGMVSITRKMSDANGSIVKNTVVINQSNQKKTVLPDLKQNEDISKLMDKMLMEIKIIDTDETNTDTLKHVIQKVFENKGIFLPFEFSLKKMINTSKTQVLSQSSHFDSTKVSYRSDLSANKIFTTNNFLFVQFPNAGDFVFSKMKSILFSSVIFSFIIIAVFYFTLKTILKQKKLSEIKNDFINNMTHELKTPIATISLAIDALNNVQTKHNEEKFNLYTSILKEENDKLNNHVERVLQMALLDKSELQLHQNQFNVIELINATITAHQLQINKQQAQIIFDTQQPEVKITADKFHLLNVFNNLLDNALKYSKENCVIEITVTKTSNDVFIGFRDNGIGIEPVLQDKVFEKFFREQGGNLHDVKGFGLGLSYVKSIVESHHGTIDLKSEKGKGSVFTIKLPINES